MWGSSIFFENFGRTGFMSGSERTRNCKIYCVIHTYKYKCSIMHTPCEGFKSKWRVWMRLSESNKPKCNIELVASEMRSRSVCTDKFEHLQTKIKGDGTRN